MLKKVSTKVFTSYLNKSGSISFELCDDGTLVCMAKKKKLEVLFFA